MRDFFAFLVFVLLILLVLLAGWWGLRSYGLSQPPSPFQTPLIEQLQQSSQQKPILWQASDNMVQAHFDNGKWRANGQSLARISHKTCRVKSSNLLPEGCSEEKSKVGLVTSPVGFCREQSSASAPQGFRPKVYEKCELGQWVDRQIGASQAPNKILLFFAIKQGQALHSLRKIFQAKERWKHTLFCSRFDGILKDLRQLEPQWSFCNGEIYMTRFLALSSLGLESLVRINADVFFIHTANTSFSAPDLKGIIKEAHRQNKLVFIGPVNEPWKGVSADGWVVTPAESPTQPDQ